MSTWKHPVADSEVERVAVEIDQKGYGCLVDYVTAEEIATARALATTAVDAAGGEYVCFTGSRSVAGTVLAELPRAASFRRTCERLYTLGTGDTAPDEEFYQIFRCLKGSSGLKHANRFHYDSYVLTALLPVALPDTEPAGNLVMLPNRRPIRRHYPANAFDKILADNTFAQASFRRAVERNSPKTTAINLRPGTMYFFWGYRSVHTNQPSDPCKLRATALFHLGDPHRDSRTRALFRRLHGRLRGAQSRAAVD